MKFAAGIVFSYIFILGLAFTLLVPPLQKPDEHGHFLRSLLLAKGHVFLTNKNEHMMIEKQYVDLMRDPLLNSIPYHPERKFDYSWYNTSTALSESKKLVSENTWGQFMLPASSYLPYAAGIAIARLLNLNAYLTFFAGRVFMFVLCFVWCLFLYKKTPAFFKPAMLFAFSLPMFIHQISGYNYDAMHYLTGFSLLVLLLQYLSMRHISSQKLVLLGIGFVLFFIMKLSFEPLILLLFLIPREKISSNFTGYFKRMLLLFGLIVGGYIACKLPFFLSASRYSHHPTGISPSGQLAYILQYPLQYIFVFLTSTIRLLPFHLQGAVGIFGWLDYSMEWWVYLIYALAGIVLVCMTHIPKSKRLTSKQLLLIVFSLFTTYAYMMTIFYLNWKAVAANHIDGTQGRYFIVTIPYLLLVAMHIKFKSRLGHLHPLMKVLFVLLVTAVLVSVVGSIQTRYF